MRRVVKIGTNSKGVLGFCVLWGVVVVMVCGTVYDYNEKGKEVSVRKLFNLIDKRKEHSISKRLVDIRPKMGVVR